MYHKTSFQSGIIFIPTAFKNAILTSGILDNVAECDKKHDLQRLLRDRAGLEALLQLEDIFYFYHLQDQFKNLKGFAGPIFEDFTPYYNFTDILQAHPEHAEKFAKQVELDREKKTPAAPINFTKVDISRIEDAFYLPEHQLLFVYLDHDNDKEVIDTTVDEYNEKLELLLNALGKRSAFEHFIQCSIAREWLAGNKVF